MYGYKEGNRRLTKEEILKYVKQEEIYQMVIGYYPKELIYVTSPFRKDRNAGCYFEWYKGILYFKDWGYTKKHKDCFNAVQVKLGLSFFESLSYIINHFGLDDVTNKPKIALSQDTLLKEQQEREKQQTGKEFVEISFMVRVFNSTSDKKFWSPYEITKENLLEDNIFPIIWYRLFSKRLGDYIVIRPATVCYLIYNNQGKVKIYTPHSLGKGKWMTNCSEDEVGGLSSLKAYGQLLIIAKSYKDYRVLKNQGLNVVWFQNEGMFPSEEILLSLVSRFVQIVVFFDNDRAGIAASETLVEVLNKLSPNKARGIHLPILLLKEHIKDPSDLIKSKGKETLLKFLHKNKII